MRSFRMSAVAPVALFGLVAMLMVVSSGAAFAQDEGDEPVPEEGDATGDETGDDEDGEPVATTEPGPEGEAPVRVRLRRLEQRVQALKERAWRSKARVGMLKETVLGGGVGAQATIVHQNKMGRAFSLVKLVYAIDGTQVFTRADDEITDKTIEVFTGPIAPGNHTISVIIEYRGSGFGPFKYLKNYKFTVKSSHTFTAAEGKATRIEVVGYEKGGFTTQMKDRPAVEFKVNTAEGAPAK